MPFRPSALVVASLLLLTAPAARPQTERKIDDLLRRLTLEEKIALLHGDSKFTTAAIPRLGIPRRWLSDGPHGIREDVGPDTWKPAGHTDDFSTAMPCELALAATFDGDAAERYGKVIGSEARRRGKQILLGPGVNIQRTPLSGRNFEFFGEDPYLAGRMAVPYIRGVQSQGVAACVKHFAANNQETGRESVDVRMDERTLREIYLPAFRAAVTEGGVLTVMSAYNRFRGTYCSENGYLLNDILKGEWGFSGLVVSDWGAAHTTDGCVRGGLDLEMGSGRANYDDYCLARSFRDAIRAGKYPMSVLDDKVRRNLRVMFATHVFDNAGGPGALNTPAHEAESRRIAEESMVLLKNDGGLLPLDPARVRSMAVIGANATRRQLHSGGSSALKTMYEVTPLEGLVRRFGRQTTITFAEGYDDASDERTLFPDDPAAGAAPAAETADERIERAVAAARAADVALIVGGLNHSRFRDAEGTDRKSLALPFGQDELIRRVAAANPRTVVVLLTGGAVDMTGWLDRAPAVVEAWYGGMEAGNALAAVLAGDVDPSGRLPCTFPRRLQDSPAHALGAYPGVDGVEEYREGIFVGYRWFDAKRIEPLFPFGFGLSYTTFAYGRLRAADPAHATLSVTNTGSRPGAEVVQLYVRPLRAPVDRPVRELKGVARVFLRPGETRDVTFALPPSAYAYYDISRRAWVCAAGEYALDAGASSRDVRATATVRVAGRTVEN